MRIIHALFAASAVLLAGQAQAAPFNINPLGTVQTTYNALSDDLAALTWMNPSNSAEAHSAGIIPVGVQVAVEAGGLTLDPNATHWADAGVTGAPSVLVLPRIRISAGIPFGLDFSYMSLSIPDSNVKVSGYEARMALGSFIPVPMLEANVRIHKSSLNGVPNMEINNTGFGVMVGGNFPIIKPYFELGTVKSVSTPSAGLTLLKEHSTTNTTTTIGAKVELAFFVLNFEKSTVGDKDLTTAKIGFEF